MNALMRFQTMTPISGYSHRDGLNVFHFQKILLNNSVNGLNWLSVSPSPRQVSGNFVGVKGRPANADEKINGSSTKQIVTDHTHFSPTSSQRVHQIYPTVKNPIKYL
jgi:hypothetical protein